MKKIIWCKICGAENYVIDDSTQPSCHNCDNNLLEISVVGQASHKVAPFEDSLKHALAAFYAFIFFASITLYGLSFCGYSPDLTLQLYIPISLILSFNYVWLKWSDVKGIIVEKQKYKIPGRIFFWVIALLVIYQVGSDAWFERKDFIRDFLSLNMFFSLLMTYSYVFGKTHGNLVLFKFFD